MASAFAERLIAQFARTKNDAVAVCDLKPLNRIRADGRMQQASGVRSPEFDSFASVPAAP